MLVKQRFKLDQPMVVALPLNTRVVIDGIGVTLVDAHHCPGAVIFIFEIPLGYDPNNPNNLGNPGNSGKIACLESKETETVEDRLNNGSLVVCK